MHTACVPGRAQVHHVLPSISLVHYRALYPKFRAVCRKHGFDTSHDCCTLRSIATHVGFVYRLGRGDDFAPRDAVAGAAEADVVEAGAAEAGAIAPVVPPVAGGGTAALVASSAVSAD